jgi:hypothetical protein
MSKKFESNLVGRSVTPIPVRTQPNYHLNDDLPQNIVYRIHTVYLEEGEPVALSEKIDVLDIEKHHDMLAGAPKGAKMWVGTIGQLWELLP